MDAFQKPFQPQGGGPLKPFTAVDLAPPAKPGSQGPLGHPVNPFLENFSSPFEGGGAEKPAAPAMPPATALTAVSAPPPLDPLPPIPPLPVAARQSHILAAADLHAAAGSAIKPRFFLTSTDLVDGQLIKAYLDVISVEIVLPKDLLFRNPAPYGELHRLKAAEDQLQKVKAKAMEELTDKAKAIHADGIVGVTVSFINLDTVCCLCSAVGTAVKVV